MKAFPIDYNVASIDKWQGMDLRDYFAAKAMQGFIASPRNKFPHQTTHEYVVDDAYTVADAMMKAREVK